LDVLTFAKCHQSQLARIKVLIIFEIEDKIKRLSAKSEMATRVLDTRRVSLLIPSYLQCHFYNGMVSEFYVLDEFTKDVYLG